MSSCGLDRRGKLGLIRLERHYRSEGRLRTDSSFVEWLRSAQEHFKELHLIVPTLPGDDPEVPSRWFEPRSQDRHYPIPDAAGYLRVLAGAPLIALQMTRMRRSVESVLCRVPEHGSIVVLPLLAVLRYKPVIWLVADRASQQRAERSRRGKNPKLFAGLMLGLLNEKVEKYFLRRWPVIANGRALGEFARQIKSSREGVLEIVSSTFSIGDLPKGRRSRPGDESEWRLLYVGRLASEKGLFDLVSAASALAERFPSRRISLDMVGWAAHGEKDRLHRQVPRGIPNLSIRFTGPKRYGPELFWYYNRADVFVLPSHSEGTPRSLIEAMAFSLPIVATAVGGVPEMLGAEEVGLLVPPRDPAALAAVLADLLLDPARRREMGQRGPQRARLYALESLVPRMASFIAAATTGI